MTPIELVLVGLVVLVLAGCLVGALVVGPVAAPRLKYADCGRRRRRPGTRSPAGPGRGRAHLDSGPAAPAAPAAQAVTWRPQNVHASASRDPAPPSPS